MRPLPKPLPYADNLYNEIRKECCMFLTHVPFYLSMSRCMNRGKRVWVRNREGEEGRSSCLQNLIPSRCFHITTAVSLNQLTSNQQTPATVNVLLDHFYNLWEPSEKITMNANPSTLHRRTPNLHRKDSNPLQRDSSIYRRNSNFTDEIQA